MGIGNFFPTVPEEALEPLPGSGAADPKFDRIAGRWELAEQLEDQTRDWRGLGDPGIGDYQQSLRGQSLAAQARTVEELLTLLRREMRSSHGVRKKSDVAALARAAFGSFARQQGITDPDFVANLSASLHREYDDQQLRDRRERVGNIARTLEADEGFRARLAWSEKVDALADAAGLDPEFVEAVLYQYQKQTEQPFPGTIRPAAVPGIGVLGVQRVGIAIVIKDFILPFTGVGEAIALYETITGKDLLTGRELALWERVLGTVGFLLPIAGKAASKSGRVVSMGVRGAAKAIRAIPGAAEVATLAIRAQVGVRQALILMGRIARMPLDKLGALLKRIRQARASRRELRLLSDEHSLMREIDEAFREFTGEVKKTAKPLAKATARSFKFLNRFQPKVLGRLLGRPLARAAPGTIATAQDVADDFAARIRAHWDAALPRGGKSAADAAKRVFDELVRLNPPKPGKFVRKRLYDAWRQRAMLRIYKDKALVRELKEKAGIIIGRNAKTDTITMHVRTAPVKGQSAQTHIDFDHGITGHADAVNNALAKRDFRELVSTVDSANLQLMTARENENFIEVLREADRAMGAP